MKFYLEFFDFVKGDILKVVQESQCSQKVLRALNSTFLALIPNKKDYAAFKDFISISYCNVIYKIISKVIAHHINPILNDIIVDEKFSFLHGRKIHNIMSLS